MCMNSPMTPSVRKCALMKADWRHVEVTEHCTAQDFAHQMRWLVDVRYPDAEGIELIVDNLNIHKLASLYETFEPAEANRIARRLWSFTTRLSTAVG